MAPSGPPLCSRTRGGHDALALRLHATTPVCELYLRAYRQRAPPRYFGLVDHRRPATQQVRENCLWRYRDGIQFDRITRTRPRGHNHPGVQVPESAADIYSLIM
jgi:hypothetical protein